METPSSPWLADQSGHVHVERHQGRDEGLLVADDDALRHEGMGPESVLEDGRGDVLAAGGHEDLLLAARDVEVAVLVEVTDVAGVEPAVDDGVGRGGVVVVAGEDPDALEQNLAVPGDPDPEPGSGGPTVPILILSGVLTAIGAVVS